MAVQSASYTLLQMHSTARLTSGMSFSQ